MSDSLKNELDNVLLTKAEGIARSINTYWEIEKMDALKHGAAKDIFRKVNNLNFHKIARRWVEERSNDSELMDIIVQIYKPDGELITNSPNSPLLLNISPQALKSLEAKTVFYEERKLPVDDGNGLDLRVLRIPVLEDGKTAYIVQVASPLNSFRTAMNRLKLILFFLLPITVITAGVFAGKFLASITLKPLKNMIETARQITAENMGLRISVPESKDEIRELAETFNDMLGKIQHVLISQRQFVQDISHELRTPMTIMRGELEVALKRRRTPEEYQSILASSLDETKKIGKLLEDLLSLARFDTSSAALAREAEDISSVIKEIVDDMRHLAQPKGIEIDLISTAGLMLSIDKPKIMRCFINIIDNAIKYTPENGRIAVRVAQENQSVVIVISDTGIGIPETDLPHIFNRFYQVDKSRSSQGFGLGLSIARSVIEAHGGSITVQSTENRGTSFLISFPLRSPASERMHAVSYPRTVA